MRTSTLLFSGLLLVMGASQAADPVPADNSGINKRDRSSAALTPENQSQSKEDIDLVAAARRAVVAEPNLSIGAQNIKIIALNGAVTLRGPVKNAAEKERVEKAVRQATGTASVDNQLEIK